MPPFADHDHFSEKAADYAAFRPSYPAEFIAWLASLAPARAVAWDCGTGSGQAARLLAMEFETVLATDASREQIARAVAHPRVRYSVALEDDSGAAPGSVDLVTVAQALHWFDLPRFYREVRRVLKPAGVLAVWCYERIQIAAAIDPVIDWFYSRRVGPFWPPERRHVEAGYQDLDFPFEELASRPWSMTASFNREELLGYVGTWSAVAKARAQGVDPLPELAEALVPVWPRSAERLTVSWPLAMRIGR